MIKTVLLLIEHYNEGETQHEARTHVESLGLSCFTALEQAQTGLNSADTFAFTDDRSLADLLKARGIGFAVYDNAKSKAASFPDALYLIDQICALSLAQIERMLLRFLKLPWQIAKTTRCLIREITVDDVDALYGIYNESAEAFQYTEGLFEDPDREKAYTRDYIGQQYRFYEYGIWIVTDRETGKIIGRAGIDNRQGYEDPELGYVFALSYRHKGYAFEVCSAILTYAANILQLERLNAFTIRENTDSVKLLERLGFVFAEEVLLNNVRHDRYRITL